MTVEQTVLPEDKLEFSRQGATGSLPSILMIGCGAVAKEMVALIKANKWNHVELTCLPAIWHNSPDKIPGGMAAKIDEAQASGKYDKIVCLYADCGTGGMLDRVLREKGVERIPGPHCYDFFSGTAAFDALMEEELGSFFVTDYLIRFFDRLIMHDFGLAKHPELIDMMFGNYKRFVYLSQLENDELKEKAKEAAKTLGLEYHYVFTGYGDLATFMARAAE